MFVHLFVEAATAGENIEWAMGVMMMTQDGFAGGVPDPGIDEPNWYLYDARAAHSSANSGPLGREYDYDIRTARRVPDKQSVLALIMTNNHVANQLVFQLSTRLLVKLP